MFCDTKAWHMLINRILLDKSNSMHVQYTHASFSMFLLICHARLLSTHDCINCVVDKPIQATASTQSEASHPPPATPEPAAPSSSNMIILFAISVVVFNTIRQNSIICKKKMLHFFAIKKIHG